MDGLDLVERYGDSAPWYDAVYEAIGDHAASAAALAAWIERRNPGARTVLEGACGTGLVLRRLADRGFEVDGFDLAPAMIAQARRRLPGARLWVDDLRTWTVRARYDAIVCVGSSIAYVVTEAALRDAIGRMADRLAPGGVLLVEPWFPPEVWEDGRRDRLTVDRDGTRIVRESTSSRDGDRSILRFDFRIDGPGVSRRFSESHVMGLFTDGQMRSAFARAGLAVERDAAYPTGRGLYVATRRPSG